MKNFNSVVVSFCTDTDVKSSHLRTLVQQRRRFSRQSGILDVRSVQSGVVVLI